MRAALGKAARIEGDDAIGLSQPTGYLPDQYGDQGAMIPPCGADEILDDLSLHIDERRNVLGILAGQVGKQSLEVEVHEVRAGLGLSCLLVGHDEVAQTIHHLIEDVGGDGAIAQ
jgi:hypothetical protein